MTISRTLLTAAVLVVSIPAVPSFAHDFYDRHARDHARHERFHDRADRRHERAHEEGFYSRSEHRAYHRAQRHGHHHFHDDHPGTRHDHYSWRQ